MSFIRRFFLLLLPTLVLLSGCEKASNDWSAREDILATAADDPEMDIAIEKARETLPQFWQALLEENKDDHSFNIKVGLPADNGGVEHIWVDNVSKKGSEISGALINVPMHLSQYELGDFISFSTSQVTDWQFIRNGKSEGNHVTKVLLKRMSPEKSDEIKKILGWQ